MMNGGRMAEVKRAFHLSSPSLLAIYQAAQLIDIPLGSSFLRKILNFTVLWRRFRCFIWAVKREAS
jgi:hypothetical protein